MKNKYQEMCIQIKPDETLTQKTLSQFTGKGTVRTHKHRRVAKPAAIAAGILAFAIAFPYLQSAGTHVTPQAAGNPSSTAAAQNTFGLAAYAAETKQSGNTVVLQMQQDELYESLSTGSAQGNYVTITYRPNLQCKGTNLKSVQYSLDTSALDKEEQAFFFQKTGENDAPDTWSDTDQYAHPFTIDYQKNDITAQLNAYEICISKHLTDTAWEARDKALKSAKNFDDFMKNPETAKINEDDFQVQDTTQMVQILSKTRMVLKATFLDGSVRTQTYQITPRDDYKKNLAATLTYENQLCIELYQKFPLDRDNCNTLQKQQNDPKRTAFEKELIQRGLAFEKQHPLYNITQTEASAPETKNSFTLAAYSEKSDTYSNANSNEIAFALETERSGSDDGVKSGASFHISGTNLANVEMQIDHGKIYQIKRVTKELTSKDEQAEAEAFMRAEDKAHKPDKTLSFFSWQQYLDNGKKLKPSEAFYIEGTMLGKKTSVSYNAQYSYGLFAPAEELAKIDPPSAAQKKQGLLYGQNLEKVNDLFNGAVLKITATYKDGSRETKTLHLKTESRRIGYDQKNQVNMILPKDTKNTQAPLVKVLCADIT